LCFGYSVYCLLRSIEKLVIEIFSRRLNHVLRWFCLGTASYCLITHMTLLSWILSELGTLSTEKSINSNLDKRVISVKEQPEHHRGVKEKSGQTVTMKVENHESREPWKSWTMKVVNHESREPWKSWKVSLWCSVVLSCRTVCDDRRLCCLFRQYIYIDAFSLFGALCCFFLATSLILVFWLLCILHVCITSNNSDSIQERRVICVMRQ
jgi:hypothetical protein